MSARHTGSIAVATDTLNDHQCSDSVNEYLLSIAGDLSTGLAAARVIGI